MKNLPLKAKIIERYGTQSDFSRIVNLREDRLSRLIHGRARATAEEKNIISQKLGVSPSEIFPA